LLLGAPNGSVWASGVGGGAVDAASLTLPTVVGPPLKTPAAASTIRRTPTAAMPVPTTLVLVLGLIGRDTNLLAMPVLLSRE
jgi:hypothetical protein